MCSIHLNLCTYACFVGSVSQYPAIEANCLKNTTPILTHDIRVRCISKMTYFENNLRPVS